MFNQAEKIIHKFGGHSKLAKLIGLNRVQVYRWTYSREKGGTGGLIPTNAFAKVLNAARMEGILLTMDDLTPEKKIPRQPKQTTQDNPNGQGNIGMVEDILS